MKKKFLIIFILLITCGILTGCGETEEDIKCAEDPDKCIKESFKRTNKKEIELVSKEEKVDKYGTTTLLNYKLKDDESITFEACAYWEVGVIGTSTYKYQSTYQEVYTEKILKKHFANSSKFIFVPKQSSNQHNNFCTLISNLITIEIKDINDISELYNELLLIKDEKEIFSVSTSVKYQNKEVYISLNDNISNEEVLKRLEELKNT